MRCGLGMICERVETSLWNADTVILCRAAMRGPAGMPRLLACVVLLAALGCAAALDPPSSKPQTAGMYMAKFLKPSKTEAAVDMGAFELPVRKERRPLLRRIHQASPSLALRVRLSLMFSARRVMLHGRSKPRRTLACGTSSTSL